MRWRIELFGGPRLTAEDGRCIDRFPTQKTAGLLAYLALTLPRTHAREVLAELFWPDKDPALSRNSLSGALFALRGILGEALVADRLRVGLDPAVCATDLDTRTDRSADDFLPGLYDDWAVAERERLRARLEAAPRAVSGKLHGLPPLDDRFVGRDSECAAVGARLQTASLVTIKGMGGVGKTRLAYELARRSRERFPGGVFWVALETVQTVDGLHRQLAAALVSPPPAGATLADSVGRSLDLCGDCLLVLDNTEQIEGVAGTVRALRVAAPACCILVTSRQKLGLRAEQVCELDPLPLPDAERLFRERADTGGGALRGDDGAVTELCRRLDGLPLALELAAARTDTLTPRQMLARIEERFRLLQSRASELPERHQTLRATIDWSYGALHVDDQRFLAQLSVFVGPFSLEDAETVCESAATLEGIASLRERSLLTVERQGESRFALLESLRAYAAERLADDPAQQAATRARHADRYLTLAQAQLARLRTAQEPEALRELDRLAPNLRAALESAPAAVAPSLALALARPLQRRGFFAEAAPILDRGLAAARLAELVWERAGLHFDQEELADARDLAAEARALYAAQGEPLGVGRSENLLGQVRFRERDWSQARLLLQQALATLAPIDAPLDTAIVRNNLALVEMGDPDGDRERAVALLTDALIVRRAHGDLRGVAVVVNNLGNLAFARADWEAADRHFTEALEVEGAVGNVFGIARALNNKGEAAEKLERRTQALRLYLAAHRLFDALRHEYAAYTESLVQQLAFPDETVAALRDALRSKNAEEIVHWAHR